MLDDFTAAGATSLRIEKLDSDLDIHFETYSDAKLASLLFDNDISIIVLEKFFGVILDPKFKLQEVTFMDFRSIFEHISLQRRQGAFKRELRLSPFKTNPHAVITENNIPPTALELVVETMLEDSVPLGIAAMEPYWKDAYAKNGLDFRNMSLVNRSWTAIAQRALRRRVVVPYHRIDMFLLSPLCGPWVKEMVIYWTVDDGYRSVNKDDILLLEVLLKRTPNMLALSFNTSLVYPYYDGDSDYEPSFDVTDCLNALSELPSLEFLWLKHFRRPDVLDTYRHDFKHTLKRGLDICPGLRSLCARIPKFQSLKFLSIWGWGSDGSSSRQPNVNFDEHPSYRLKSIELYKVGDSLISRCEDDLLWLLKPRSNYRLKSLSTTMDFLLVSHERNALEDYLSELSELRLWMFIKDYVWGNTNIWPIAAIVFASCKKLDNLELFFDSYKQMCFKDFDPAILPSSITHWTMHFHYIDLRRFCSLPGEVSIFFRKLEHALFHLPLLRNVLMTALSGNPFVFCDTGVRIMQMVESVRDMSEAAVVFKSTVIQEHMESFMEKHNIELSCIWNPSFPKGEEVDEGFICQ